MRTASVENLPAPARVGYAGCSTATRAYVSPVTISGLAPGDRAALPDLIEAAACVDRIYWQQRWPEGSALRRTLAQRGDLTARELERLLALNVGPWDNLDEDRSFWGDAVRPMGGEFYPPDLTREEFRAYLDRHLGEAPALLRHTTLGKADGWWRVRTRSGRPKIRD